MNQKISKRLRKILKDDGLDIKKPAGRAAYRVAKRQYLAIPKNAKGKFWDMHPV